MRHVYDPAVASVIKEMNVWRNSIIQSLFSCIHLVPKTLEPATKIDEPKFEEVMTAFLNPISNPAHKGFSDGNIQYYLDGALSRVQQAVSRKNFDLACQFRAMCNILKDELSRRKTEKDQEQEKWDKEQEQRRVEKEVAEKKLTDEYSSWLANETAKRESELKTVREAEAKKRAAAAAAPQYQDKTVSHDIKDLAGLIVEQRKQGKFSKTTKIKKAEVSKMLSDNNVEMKDGVAVLPDFRRIIATKSGAVTRYLLQE